MFGGVVQPVNKPVGLMEFFSKEALVGMRSFPLIFLGLLCPLAST